MKKKTHEEFISQINIINPNIEILDTYEKDNIKIHTKCKVCGYDWYATPSNLLQGKGCIMCHRQKLKDKNTKTHHQFLLDMKTHPNIEVLGIYKNNHTKIAFRCIKHNNTFLTTPHNVLYGMTGCQECIKEKSKQKLKSQDDFIRDVKNVNPNIDIVGEYIGAREKIDVQCKECGRIWKITAYSLLQGNGCPSCKLSKGERKIIVELDNREILYEQQKKFENLKGVGGLPLSYDFFLPNYNLLIEYQGRQHKMPIEVFGGTEYFEIQKQHDKLKREYAVKHNYQLLEIWYYDYKRIAEIIDNIINNSRIS